VVAVDRVAVAQVVDDERRKVADLLESLSPEQMRTPSLCAGWTVREVAAHLALSAVGPGRVAVELIRYRGNLARTGRETARRLAARESDAALVALLRGMVGNRGHLLGTSYLDPLVDVLVHGQDIAVPVGRRHEMPVLAGAAAAQRVATMRYWSRIRSAVGGVRLEANDTDWTYGSGPVVRGPIAVLLLVLTGRRARTDELTGPGVGSLASAPLQHLT
jgi:uncharacterized protein (TIGR03083 family)